MGEASPAAVLEPLHLVLVSLPASLLRQLPQTTRILDSELSKDSKFGDWRQQ
jgi:hypothetical protein